LPIESHDSIIKKKSRLIDTLRGMQRNAVMKVGLSCNDRRLTLFYFKISLHTPSSTLAVVAV
jgi:hypothetical protein